jgi:hypothetical protein
MTVTLKANKYREKSPRRPRSLRRHLATPRNILLFMSGVQVLTGNLDVRRPEFRCKQIGFMKDIAELRYNIPISIDALTRACDCPRSGVQAALMHGLADPGQRGKHIALDHDREQQILE